MRTRSVVAGLVALSAVAACGIYLADRALDLNLPLPRAKRGCTVHDSAAPQPSSGPRSVRLSLDQMANAATIAAVGIRKRMPERAVVVALATAMQESRLENLAGGDRDSVGLFQQRPSQGWGKPEQILDPRYAAERFYSALKKVPEWQKMRVTDAAQAVQRSAFPEAYEQWADQSAVLASALVGQTTGAVACTPGRDPALRGSDAVEALTAGLRLDWGRVETVTPADLVGVAVAAADAPAGWRYAHWLVAHASGHGVQRVRFGELQWTAKDGVWGAASGDPADAGMVIAEVFTGG